MVNAGTGANINYRFIISQSNSNTIHQLSPRNRLQHQRQRRIHNNRLPNRFSNRLQNRHNNQQSHHRLLQENLLRNPQNILRRPPPSRWHLPPHPQRSINILLQDRRPSHLRLELHLPLRHAHRYQYPRLLLRKLADLHPRHEPDHHQRYWCADLGYWRISGHRGTEPVAHADVYAYYL